MSQTYIAWNGAEPTTASRIPVATGTSIKTLLQVATPSTAEVKIIEWGISFDGNTAAVPGIIELIQTDVAATGGTSLTPTLFENPNGPVSLCVGGAALTCFSPSGEGTITAVRSLGGGHIMGTNQFVQQYPLGREPRVPVSKFLRIRVKFAASVNAICYIVWDE